MVLNSIGSFSELSNQYKTRLKNTAAPNWNDIPSKGMPRPSDKEFEKIIDEMGKALAEARENNDDTYASLVRKFEGTLRTQYISDVSPDRKALYDEAMPYINKVGVRASFKPHDPPKDFLDYLNEHDAKLKPSNRGRFEIQLKSGTNITFTGSDLQPDSFEIRESAGGPAVLSKGGGNWATEYTPQEWAKSKEFLTKVHNAEKRHLYFPTDSTRTGLDTKA